MCNGKIGKKKSKKIYEREKEKGHEKWKKERKWQEIVDIEMLKIGKNTRVLIDAKTSDEVPDIMRPNGLFDWDVRGHLP